MEKPNGTYAVSSIITDLAFLEHVSSLANVSLERLISRSLHSANPTSRYHAALQELTWFTEKAIEEALLKRSSLSAKLKSELEVEVVYCKLPLISLQEQDIPHIEWNIEEALSDKSTPISFSELEEVNGKRDERKIESVKTRKVHNDTLQIRCCLGEITRDAYAEISAVLLSKETQIEYVKINFADTLIIRHVLQFFLDAFYGRVGNLLASYDESLLEKHCVKVIGSALKTAKNAYKTLSDNNKKISVQLMLYNADAKALYYPKFDLKMQSAPSDSFYCTNLQDLARSLRSIQDVVETMKPGDPNIKFLGSQQEIYNYLSEETCLTADVSILGSIGSWNKFCREFLTFPLNQFVNFLPYFGDKKVKQEWVEWFLKWTLAGQGLDVYEILNNKDWCNRIQEAEKKEDTLACFVDNIPDTGYTAAESWLKVYFLKATKTILSFQPLGEGFAGRIAKNLIAEFLPHSEDKSFAAENRKSMPYKIMGLLETVCGLIYSESTLVGIPLMGKGQLLGVLIASLQKNEGRLNETDLLIFESISYKIGNMLEEFLDARICEYLAKSWNELKQTTENITEAYEEWLRDFARCLPIAVNLDIGGTPAVTIRRLSGKSVYPEDTTQINLGDEFDLKIAKLDKEAKSCDYPKLIPNKSKNKKGHIGLYIPTHPVDERDIGGYIAMFSMDGNKDISRIDGIWEIFWEHEQELALFFSSCIGITGAISRPPQQLQETPTETDHNLFIYSLKAFRSREENRPEEKPKFFSTLIGESNELTEIGLKTMKVLKEKNSSTWIKIVEIAKNRKSTQVTKLRDDELYKNIKSDLVEIVSALK